MLNLSIFLIILSPYTPLIPALYIAFLTFRNRQRFHEAVEILNSPWNGALMLAFMWALAVGLVNGSPLSVAAAFCIPLYLMITMHLQMYYSTQERAELLIRKLMEFSLFAAALGVLEKAASYFIDMTWVSRYFWSPTYIPSQEAYRIYSTFGNPNMTGSWFAAMAIIAFYFFERSQGREKVRHGLMAGLFVLVMAFSGSRGAVLGLEIGLTAYALFKRSRTSLVPVAVALFSVLVLTVVFPEINHPFNSRDAIWSASMALYEDKPLSGWGLIGVYSQLGEIHAHNIWITVAATLGSVGLCILFFMKYQLYRGLQVLNRARCGLTPLLAGIMGLMFGHGLVDFVILTPQGGLIFFGCAALITGMAARQAEAADAKTVPVFSRGSMETGV